MIHGAFRLQDRAAGAGSPREGSVYAHFCSFGRPLPSTADQSGTPKRGPDVTKHWGKDTLPDGPSRAWWLCACLLYTSPSPRD